tara:strand:- start:150 stop:533 length:384 start_codon:yes stop_codon:yes gene_type:complete
MALTRCINYLLEGDEDILADCIDEAEMIEFAAKNALAIIVYDIVEEHEDDEDKSLARLISIQITNHEFEFDLDEKSENLFEDIPVLGEKELSVEDLWEQTIIPSLCQEFSTAELNSFVYLSVDIVAK